MNSFNKRSYSCDTVKSLLFITLLCIIFLSVAFADMDYSVFSFSHLFDKADCVVSGTVVSCANDEQDWRMTVDVEDVLYGTAASSIKVISPFVNGSFREDEAYLGEGQRCILFLKKNGDIYNIVNGIAGVIKPETKDDVKTVAFEYEKNPALFSKENMSAMIKLYESLHENETKKRLLECMKGKYSNEEAPFLLTLLDSGDPYLQMYAAVQSGFAKIEDLRHAIESLCVSTNNVALRSESLFAIAQYEDNNSIPIVRSFFDDPNSEVRSNAYFASGVIGSSEVAESLIERFNMESDYVMRMTIVSALGGIKDKQLIAKILPRLKVRETNEIVLRHIDFTIEKLDQRANQ